MLSSLGMGVLNGCVLGDLQGAFTRFPPVPPPIGAVADMFDSDEDVFGDSATFVSFNTPFVTQPSTLDFACATPELFPLVQSLSVNASAVSDHSSLSITFSPLQVTRTSTPNQTPQRHARGCMDVWDEEFKTLYQHQVQRDRPLLQQIVACINHNSTPRMIARTTRAYMSRLRRCRARAVQTYRSSPRQCNISGAPESLSAREFWSRDMKVLHRQVLDLHHKYRTTGQGRHEYTQARNRYTKLLRTRRRAFEAARDKYILRQLKGHPRAFWKWWLGKEPATAEITPNVFCDHMQSALGTQPEPLPRAHQVFDNHHPQGGTTPLDMSSLNSPFTVQEVVNAIYKLRNGRSSSDRIQAELLRYARDPDPELPNAVANYIKTDLTTLLNKVFLSGLGIPRAWLKAYVTPVFKQKGSASQPANYRPITVSSLLYKLFSNILLTRLQLQLETLGLRAPTQLGFRPNKGTEHAVWLLQHCITLACSPRQRGGYGGYLYTCFVDLKAAFDSVCRQELWEHLEALGITPGTFLTAVKSLYASTTFSVKIGPKHSDNVFQTHKGVKQGCPLSPMLFGLLMDRLHSRIKEDCPDVGVRLLDDEGTIVSCIMYADDVVLLAQSETDLQRLVDALHGFCADIGLAVNTTKSVVMVFEQDSRSALCPPVYIRIGDQILSVVDSFTYLGVPFHRTKWLTQAGNTAAQAATGALWAFWKGVQTRGIVCKDTILRIYRTQVLPVALYGSSIWGMHYLSVAHADSVLHSPVQDVQNLFLRLLHNAPTAVSRWLLHYNVDLKPTQYHMFMGVARLWHALRRDAPILRKALQSDLALFCHGHDTCWSRHFIVQGQQLGAFTNIQARDIAFMGVDDFFHLSFKVGDIRTKVTEFYQALWEKEGQGSSYTVDGRDDSTDSISRFQSYIFMPGSRHHLEYHGSSFLVDTLFRFRIGAAGLRASLHTSSQEARICRLCHHGDIEDECHVVKHCPAYSHIRSHDTFSSLLRVLTLDGLRALFNVPDQHKLACFLSEILRTRAHLLDVTG